MGGQLRRRRGSSSTCSNRRQSQCWTRSTYRRQSPSPTSKRATSISRPRGLGRARGCRGAGRSRRRRRCRRPLDPRQRPPRHGALRRGRRAPDGDARVDPFATRAPNYVLASLSRARHARVPRASSMPRCEHSPSARSRLHSTRPQPPSRTGSTRPRSQFDWSCATSLGLAELRRSDDARMETGPNRVWIEIVAGSAPTAATASQHHRG